MNYSNKIIKTASSYKHCNMSYFSHAVRVGMVGLIINY